MYLSCPLCGKLGHLNSFRPEEYEDIIELVEMRGLGRAKGWEVVARHSLDDEELMDRIAERCRIILSILDEETPTDTSLVPHSREEITELQETIDDYEEEFDELLVRLNGVLANIYDEEFITLKEAMEAIIVEYHEALEVEDENVLAMDEDDEEN